MFKCMVINVRIGRIFFILEYINRLSRRKKNLIIRIKNTNTFFVGKSVPWKIRLDVCWNVIHACKSIFFLTVILSIIKMSVKPVTLLLKNSILNF